jgi:hypothetical protein
VCVFEEDEEGEDDARYHEGAFEGEHRGLGVFGMAFVAAECRTKSQELFLECCVPELKGRC